MKPSRRRFLQLSSLTACSLFAGCMTDSPSTTESSTSEETGDNGKNSRNWSPPFDPVRLSPKDGELNEQFGASIDVASDGDIAVIGGYGSNQGSGSAYIYAEEDDSWVEQFELTVEEGAADDNFGKAVAISRDGSRALIGAPGEAEPNGSFSGAVYEFALHEDGWEQRSKLVPQNGTTFGRFGKTLDLAADSESVVIGAPGENTAYLFEHRKGEWQQQAKLVPGDEDLKSYAESVNISADASTIVVSDHWDTNANGPGAGAAYLFARSGNGWGLDSKVVSNNGSKYDHFGASIEVSKSGKVFVVGSPNTDHEDMSAAGSAYIFEESESGWAQNAELVSADSDSQDYLGWSTSLAGDGTIAGVGAVGDETTDGTVTGAGYVFTESDEGWTQETKLRPSGLDNDDSFGWDTELSNQGQSLLISAVDATSDTDEETGVVFVYD